MKTNTKSHNSNYKVYKRTLDYLIQAKNTISDKIKAASKIDPESGEILTLDLIRKKKSDLLEKIKAVKMK